MNFWLHNGFSCSMICCRLPLLALFHHFRNREHLSILEVHVLSTDPHGRLSVILICYFFLDIRQRNDHLNGTSQPSLQIGSFHAVVKSIHNAVIEEFGDPSFDESLRGDPLEIELQDMHSHHTEAVVDLEEYPWAAGMSGQQVGPEASGGQCVL